MNPDSIAPRGHSKAGSYGAWAESCALDFQQVAAAVGKAAAGSSPIVVPVVVVVPLVVTVAL